MMFQLRKVCFGFILSAALSFLVISQPLDAATQPDTAPNVTYKAFGTFTEPPINGSDLFRLQGEPFSISSVASAALAPKHSGPGFAVYTPLSLTGTVKSGLLSGPTNINSHAASIELSSGPNGAFFTLASPVKVIGLTLTISATVALPPGTITTLYIHPFTAPVTLTPANSFLTYSDSTDSTTLGINGTLLATQTAPPSPRADGSLTGQPSPAGFLGLSQPLDVAFRFHAPELPAGCST